MSFKTLQAYIKGFELATDVLEISKSFPKEETYSLTDSDGKNSETQVWLDFAMACNYIDENIYNELTEQSEEVGRLINYMINNPGKFGVKEN